jgi:hypothetical protein
MPRTDLREQESESARRPLKILFLVIVIREALASVNGIWECFAIRGRACISQINESGV